MAKIKKTYSLDDKVVDKLEALALAAGLNVSAYLTTLINSAAEADQGQQRPVAATAE